MKIGVERSIFLIGFYGHGVPLARAPGRVPPLGAAGQGARSGAEPVSCPPGLHRSIKNIDLKKKY